MLYDLYRVLAFRAWDRGQLELMQSYLDIAETLL